MGLGFLVFFLLVFLFSAILYFAIVPSSLSLPLEQTASSYVLYVEMSSRYLYSTLLYSILYSRARHTYCINHT